MKKYLFTLALISFFTSVASSQQLVNDTSAKKKEQGMTVLPAAVAFNLINGQSASKKITVTNRLPERNQYKVFIGDWERDSMGGHKYYPANTLPRSCARWVTVDKEIFELEPDSATTVTIRLQIPDSIEAIQQMKWAMVFVQLVNEEKPVTSEKDIVQQVVYNFRMGIHVYQTPSVLKHVLLKMVGFKPVVNMKDSIVYQMTCVNEGSQQLRVKTSFEVTNLTTGEKFKVTPKDFPMFPSQRRVVYYQLPKGIAPGKYSILATADGGDDMPLEAAQVEVNVE